MNPAAASAAAVATTTTTPPSSSPQTLLSLITNLLSVLLLSSLTAKSFTGRWQTIHSKLTSLSSSVSSFSSSPHWSENPLIHSLLPSLLSTLHRLSSLSDLCSLSDFSGGKLHMQSDLDMASASLSHSLHDLDLLLRSGVLHQSNAIVLSQPGPCSSKQDLVFFIRDLFTRLQIGGIEFKNKALESLLHLLDRDEKSASLVAKEGNIGYLIHLLDFNHNKSIREHATTAVSVLASENDESRKCVFEEGGLGPLLRILDTGSMPMKEKASAAVEAITADPENSWAVSAYGGVSVLIEACRSGSVVTQSHAVGAIRNVAYVEEIKNSLAEEGAVPVLIQLLVSGTSSTQAKAANCISLLASSGEYFRALIVQQRGVQRLMVLIQEVSNPITSEHVLRAISSLSGFDSSTRILSSSTAFITKLGEFIKHGNVLLQQISASLLASLSISDGNKRAIGDCMGSLVKLMESPKPVGLQESAAEALSSLLTVRSNRKEFVRDEKSVMRLVQMLDPKNEVVQCKIFPVMVVAAVVGGGTSQGCRKRLMAAGVHHHLQRLSEMNVAGANKALQRLSGNRLINTIFSRRTWRE